MTVTVEVEYEIFHTIKTKRIQAPAMSVQVVDDQQPGPTGGRAVMITERWPGRTVTHWFASVHTIVEERTP
jgi:hypothetical protein